MRKSCAPNPELRVPKTLASTARVGLHDARPPFFRHPESLVAPSSARSRRLQAAGRLLTTRTDACLTLERADARRVQMATRSSSTKARAATTSTPASLVPTTPPTDHVLKTAYTRSEAATFASQGDTAAAAASGSVSIPVGVFGGTAGLQTTALSPAQAAEAANGASATSSSSRKFPVLPVAVAAGAVVVLIIAALVRAGSRGRPDSAGLLLLPPSTTSKASARRQLADAQDAQLVHVRSSDDRPV